LGARRGVRGVFDALQLGYTILAPNAELAAALIDAVERLHLGLAHDVWPTPRIRDFGTWLRERHLVRQFADASLPRVLSDIEERELWRAVIQDSEAAKELLEPAGAARAARRARRAMSEYGIPRTALAAYPSEEVRALGEWTERFDERCAALNCVSADRLLASIPPDPAALVWLESPAWRPVARRWLQQHAATMLLADDVAPAAAIQRYQAASPGAELAAIAEWSGDLKGAERDARIWVCIPDLGQRRALVQDAFDAVLAPRRFALAAPQALAAYAIAGGTPLADFPSVRAALAVLSATTGILRFEAFSAVLRLPELHPSPADAAAAARTDVALRRRAPEALTLDEWLRLAERVANEVPVSVPVALLRLRAVEQRLAAVRGAQPLSRWVAAWVDAFERGPWAESARWSSGEFQAAERFREVLAALAVADALFGPRHAASAVRIVNRSARDTAFQAQTGIPPIWISGQLHDPWLTYDGLWMSGCDDRRWPPPQDPVPLVPVELQRKFGIAASGVESQLKMATELQRRWQVRARTCVFSAAAAEDGRPVQLSPLLSAAAPLPNSPRLATLATQPHWHALADAAPPLQARDDERAPRFASTERTRGVATLRAQSQCAFRGFAETRLDTAKLERPTPGFNARERGEMLHDALQRIWLELESSAALQAHGAAALESLIERSVAAAIAAQRARRDPGARWQRRELPRLCGLLTRWLALEALREPFAVERLEHDAQVARHGGLEFAVRIDRIDRLADGGRVLLDYKTGRATADWRGDRPENPQLPIYALSRPDGLVAVAYARVNASDCGFVAETGRPGVFKPGGKATALEGHADFAALLDTWAGRIERIALEFRDGDARVAPTLRACASCRLQPLCRVPSTLGAEADVDG
jgi:probable DNA repair protein